MVFGNAKKAQGKTCSITASRESLIDLTKLLLGASRNKITGICREESYYMGVIRC